jgi:hypothetical protein
MAWLHDNGDEEELAQFDDEEGGEKEGIVEDETEEVIVTERAGTPVAAPSKSKAKPKAKPKPKAKAKPKPKPKPKPKKKAAPKKAASKGRKGR